MAQPTSSRPAPLLDTALALGAAGVWSASIAAAHMWTTLQRGPICGVEAGGHCWACYLAPLLLMTALTAAHAHRTRRACLEARGPE